MARNFLRATSGGGTSKKVSDSGSSSDSSSGSDDDDGTVEPAVSPPVKDVSTDPGTSGEDLEQMAMGGDSSDSTGESDPFEGAQTGTDAFRRGGGGSPSDGGSSGDSSDSSSSGGSSSDSTGESDPFEGAQTGTDAFRRGGGGSPSDGGSSSGSGDGGSSSDSSGGGGSDGPGFDPRPGAYDDASDVGSTEDERTTGGSDGGTSGGSDPVSSGPVQMPDGDTSGAGSSDESDGPGFDPRPGAYDDETDVGSTEDEREVKQVVTGGAGDISNAVSVDENVVEQVDEQFAGTEITADDLQYTNNELQLTPDARQDIVDSRQESRRVGTGGQLGEDLMEDQIEDENPGLDVDVGRSGDGSFDVDLVDTPESTKPAGGQLGEDLAEAEAEREAREKVGEQVNEQFPNADLEAGEDFTTSVEETDDGLTVTADLTDSGRKEIAKENAPLQNTPLEGVTEWGAGVNFEYEEFRRGMHDGLAEMNFPAEGSLADEGVDWAADQVPDSEGDFPPEGSLADEGIDWAADQVPDSEGGFPAEGSLADEGVDWAADQVPDSEGNFPPEGSLADEGVDWAAENTPSTSDVTPDNVPVEDSPADRWLDRQRQNGGSGVNVDPSASGVLAASAAAVAAPEPASSVSGAVVGGATLAGLGLYSLSQDPRETRTDAELPVSDPSQYQEELSPEDFDDSVSEIGVGETDVQEVEPGEMDVNEVGIPEDTTGDVTVVETGTAGTDTGTDTGTGPGENPFSPGVGPETPGIEDVEDPTVTEDDGDGFARRRDEAPGTVTEGEVGGETTDDEAFGEVEAPSVPEEAAANEGLFGEVGNGAMGDAGARGDPFGLGEAFANVGGDAMADANANANAAALVDVNAGANADAFSQPNAFGEPTSFGGEVGNPTTTDYGHDTPFNYDYGFDFNLRTRRPRAPDDDGGFGMSAGDAGLDLGGGSSRGGVAANWFNENVATAATEGTQTFAPADDADMFGLAPLDVNDERTRREIDEAFEFFRG